MAYLWGMEMTREEVEALPAGREMDIAIGTMLGHKPVPYWLIIDKYGDAIHKYDDPMPAEFDCKAKADAYFDSQERDGLMMASSKVTRYGRWPAYSTDIAAAWKLVAHFEAGNAEIDLKKYHDAAGPSWEAAINGFGVGGCAEYCYAYAETAPLAICRAALLTTLMAEDA